MLDFSLDKTQCTGCTACYSACPVKCISMVEDEEGFLYPKVGEECIHCGKCIQICPTNKKITVNNKYKKKVFAAISKDENIWRKSSSGGAFTELCIAWGNSETLISGACWDNLNVKHKCVIGVNEIEIFQKSKYVSSNLLDCFSEIKFYLEHGGKVIFSGVPCQVAGLRSFLGKEYENLLLIDLICHGVGSPLVFKECMKELGNQFNGVIRAYEFRAKRMRKKSKCLNRRLEQLYIKNDRYIQLFQSQNCLRPSCGKNCKFRTSNRQGDITLSDFKGLTYVFPKLRGENHNYSTIIINTKMGEKVLDPIKKRMKLIECNVDDIKKYNPLFYRQTIVSEKRDIFFEEFTKDPYNTIVQWTKPTELYKISKKKKLYNVLPKNIRKGVLVIISLLLNDEDIKNREPEYSSCANSSIYIQHKKV